MLVGVVGNQPLVCWQGVFKAECQHSLGARCKAQPKSCMQASRHPTHSTRAVPAAAAHQLLSFVRWKLPSQPPPAGDVPSSNTGLSALRYGAPIPTLARYTSDSHKLSPGSSRLLRSSVDCADAKADLTVPCALPSPLTPALSPTGLLTPISPKPTAPECPLDTDGTGFCEPPRKRRRLDDSATDNVWASIETELEGSGSVPAIVLWSDGNDVSQPCEQDCVVPCDILCEEGVGYGVDLCEPTFSFLEGDVDLGDIAAQCEFEKEETSEDQVCFGMIDDCPFTMLERHLSRSKCSTLSAKLAIRCTVRSNDDDSELGVVDETTALVLHTLTNKNCELQIDIHVNLDQASPGRKGAARQAPKYRASLSVIVYGPLGEFDAVGEYLDSYEVYLQDPKGCDRNVRYRNPHRISGRDADAPMTVEQEMEQSFFRCEILERSSNYLSDLESRVDLPSTPDPHVLETRLYPHQGQALTFMLRRERGWAFHGDQPDVWKALGQDSFLNTITSNIQAGSPPDFRGGILADDMGLGKSLTMISLIASDRHPPHSQPGLLQRPTSGSTEASRCTLLVVPSSLIQTWEAQLRRHLRQKTLRWAKHHEKQKVRHRDDVKGLDVVITTYQTIASEWRRRHTCASPVFSICWHRIVLDEAHCIRDRTSLTAKAIYALNADRRWAMTGTPVQNRLSDLASLFQFLRVHPYDSPERFNEDIIRLWKDHAEDEAIDRTKKLFHLVGIRRSNNTIHLPERTDKIHWLEFSPLERQLYDSARSDTIESIDRAMTCESPVRGSYLNALHKFHTLRMMCNLGTYKQALKGRSVPRNHQQWDSSLASEAFLTLLAIGPASCKQCAIGLDEFGPDRVDLRSGKEPHMSQCGSLICHTCVQKRGVLGRSASWCGHSPPCADAPVGHVPPTLAHSGLNGFQNATSTKVQELAKDLLEHPMEKSVVFSLWTSTLDLVQNTLEARSINFVRVDGSVQEKHRKHILDDFRNEPGISVILFTISCGAVGLDLTAASRAYIMEPQWNPTVEEQALARIHRLGQTRQVTTIRFIVKGTCEEHVRRVQDRKALMADILLSQKRNSGTSKATGKLDSLRSLLS